VKLPRPNNLLVSSRPRQKRLDDEPASLGAFLCLLKTPKGRSGPFPHPTAVGVLSGRLSHQVGQRSLPLRRWTSILASLLMPTPQLKRGYLPILSARGSRGSAERLRMLAVGQDDTAGASRWEDAGRRPQALSKCLGAGHATTFRRRSLLALCDNAHVQLSTFRPTTGRVQVLVCVWMRPALRAHLKPRAGARL
jgi:hypothetical protein